MPVAQGGKPEAAVLARVGRVADPDHRDVEKARHGGEHLGPVDAAPAKIGVDRPAEPRQGAGERDEVGILHLVATGRPALVVAVLLASARVIAGDLEVAVRARRDPDLRPGGRDHEVANALEDLRLADAGAVGPEVIEAAPGPPPPDARLTRVGVDEGDVGRCGLALVGWEGDGIFHDETRAGAPRVDRVAPRP